jgi:hypothetical protein
MRERPAGMGQSIRLRAKYRRPRPVWQTVNCDAQRLQPLTAVAKKTTADSPYSLGDDWEQTRLAATLASSWMTLELVQQTVADLARGVNDRFN